ncbi:TPA_asm: P3 [Rhopalocnemis gammacytorhabdovirus 1]|nr:TPA_asm: P3 [Rhopalocnemis gammacytorhabdovirus 1]
MTSFNISSQILSTLTMKRVQVNQYGGSGEFKMKGLINRFYMYYPPKHNKYIEITEVTLCWKPTIPHMLENIFTEIRMSDSRGTSESSKSNELLYLYRPSAISWTATFRCSLTFPLCELKKGMPINFDISLPCHSVKCGHELGVFTFAFNIISTDRVKSFSFGMVPSADSTSMAMNKAVTVWKGITGSFSETDSKQVSDLVSKYLHGDLTLGELGTKMCQSLLAGPSTSNNN